MSQVPENATISEEEKLKNEEVEETLRELRPDYIISPMPAEDVHPHDRHLVRFTAKCPKVNGYENIIASGSTEDEAVFSLENKLRKLLAKE